MIDRMSQEEFDSRMADGEDPYSIVIDDFIRRGYVFNGKKWCKPQAEAEADEAE